MSKKQTPNPEPAPDKKVPVGFIVGLILLVAVGIFALTKITAKDAGESAEQAAVQQPLQNETPAPEPVVESPAATEGDQEDHSGHHHAQEGSEADARIPAFFEDPSKAKPLPPTRDPATVHPAAAKGYVVAKQKPELLTQLPCFCYCDKFGHTSLHTCFTTDHAEQCQICLDEAIEADELDNQGLSAKEIREAIIAKHQPKS